jgi:hypothetical protein
VTWLAYDPRNPHDFHDEQANFCYMGKCFLLYGMRPASETQYGGSVHPTLEIAKEHCDKERKGRQGFTWQIAEWPTVVVAGSQNALSILGALPVEVSVPKPIGTLEEVAQFCAQVPLQMFISDTPVAGPARLPLRLHLSESRGGSVPLVWTAMPSGGAFSDVFRTICVLTSALQTFMPRNPFLATWSR